MRLEDVTVAIRPRNPWESMDLGFHMLRWWWRQVYPVWLILLLPLALALNLVLWRTPWVAWLILWWVKPMLDRVLLFVYSRAVFGTPPDRREILNAVPELLLHTGLLGHLSVLRFSLVRSFHLPVLQLEGLGGKQRRARQRVLEQGGNRGYGIWLTVVCLHLEGFIFFGLIGLLALLVPEEMGVDVWSLALDETTPWMHITHNLLYLIPLSLLEPAYVAAGFALYLNRRTDLEGWDIELRLRRMARRLETPQAGNST